jgi:hypothetical protein
MFHHHVFGACLNACQATNTCFRVYKINTVAFLNCFNRADFGAGAALIAELNFIGTRTWKMADNSKSGLGRINFLMIGKSAGQSTGVAA